VTSHLLEEAGIDLALMRRRAELVARGIEECRSDEGWRLVSDDPGGLRMLYRCGPDRWLGGGVWGLWGWGR